jgi:uncharacterized membrane protein
MSLKTIGALMAIAGLLLVLVSVLADVIGVGDPANPFGPRQLTGTIIGALVLIAGVVLYLQQRQT